MARLFLILRDEKCSSQPPFREEEGEEEEANSWRRTAVLRKKVPSSWKQDHAPPISNAEEGPAASELRRRRYIFYISN
jgi:hypothetical protein